LYFVGLWPHVQLDDAQCALKLNCTLVSCDMTWSTPSSFSFEPKYMPGVHDLLFRLMNANQLVRRAIVQLQSGGIELATRWIRV
jgi:hypothetical protein